MRRTKRSKKPTKSTEKAVYECVCQHPGLCTYELSKRLDMSGGNLRSALSRLHEKGFVRFKFDRGNPRTRKLTYPVHCSGLLSAKLMRLVKKIRR